MCGEVCDDGEFAWIGDKSCVDCSSINDDCLSCEQDFEALLIDNQVCTQCSDSMIPTFDGKACTTCSFGQFEDDEGECHWCSDSIHLCGQCSYLDGEVQCGECMGDSMPVLENGEIESCGCQYVEFLNKVDLSLNADREAVECQLCNTKINHCNVCNEQIVNLFEEEFTDSELFISLSEKH